MHTLVFKRLLIGKYKKGSRNPSLSCNKHKIRFVCPFRDTKHKTTSSIQMCPKLVCSHKKMHIPIWPHMLEQLCLVLLTITYFFQQNVRTNFFSHPCNFLYSKFRFRTKKDILFFFAKYIHTTHPTLTLLKWMAKVKDLQY